MNTVTTNEKERLAELYSYHILDTVAEKEFDDLAEIASVIAGTPISAISLIDYDRQWFKAQKGLSFREGKREVAFCSHAILQDDPFLVEDAYLDSRFENNPLVTEDPNIRFYAGFPLVTSTGYKLGTLCVIDRTPRNITEQQKDILSKLALQAMKLIELRVRNQELTILKQEVEVQRDKSKLLLEHLRKLLTILAHDTRGPLGSMQTLLNMHNNHLMTKEDSAEVFTACEEQLGILLSLIENITKWGSAYVEGTQAAQSTIDLKELGDDAFSLFGHQAAKKGIGFVNALSGVITVGFKKDILNFVLRNLVNNAVKFTDKGTVTLNGMELDENRYQFSVQDTGIGMPQKIVESLFVERTFSREGTNSEKGAGLASMLIKDFIEQVDGKISVKSSENTGTCVTVTIPVVNSGV